MPFNIFWQSVCGYFLSQKSQILCFFFLQVSNYTKCIIDSWEFLLKVIVSLKPSPLYIVLILDTGYKIQS